MATRTQAGLALLCCLHCGAALAEPKRAERSLSFDSAYRPQFNSNEAIQNFGNEIDGVMAMVQDEVPRTFGFESIGIARSSFVTLFGSVWQYMLSPWYVAFHEFGHGSRAYAAGYKPEYRVTDGEKVFRKSDNFFSYYAMLVNEKAMRFGGGVGGQAAGTEEESGSFPSGRFANDEAYRNFVITSGGHNNNQYDGEMLADRIFAFGGEQIWAVRYLMSKGLMTGLTYMNKSEYFEDEKNAEEVSTDAFTSDLYKMIEFYKTKDYHISYYDIGVGQMASVLGSASTYNLLFCWGRYNWYEPNPLVSRLTLGGFRLPDLSFYMNPRGLSYKVSLGFVASEQLLFPFAFEYVYDGDKALETTAEVLFKVNNEFAARGGVTLGSALEWSLYGVYTATSHLQARVGVEIFDLKNMHGQRQIGVVNPENNRSEEYRLRASYLF